MAAIDSRDDPMHPHGACAIDRGLDHLRAEAPIGMIDGDAAKDAGRCRSSPAGLFRGGIEHPEASWKPLHQQLAPKKVRIGARRMRQLVDEALLEESVLRMVDA